MNKTIELSVKGMHCKGCELFVEKTVEGIDGVESADASLDDNCLRIKVKNEENIEKIIAKANAEMSGTDYVIEHERNSFNFQHLSNSSRSSYIKPFLIALIIVIGFFLLQQAGLAKQLNAEQITYPFIFVVGIVASLSTCMAVVGGLVLSLSSSLAHSRNYKSIGIFHISRLLGFFVFGGIIGAIGSTLQITPAFSFIMNVVLFLVMMILGLQILGFSSLSKFVTLPKFMSKNLVRQNSSNSYISVILLGLVTFILPCGFTQSMQFYALSTGSFISGALTMFVFALGTLPVLALMSFASIKFSQSLQSSLFFKTAGFLILFFAIINILSALAATGLIKPIITI